MGDIDNYGLSKIIVIDSSKKIRGSSNSSFSVDIGYNNSAHKVSKVSLVSFSAVNSVYNITENNNKFSISTDLDTVQTVTLTSGFYSVTNLNSALELLVNAVITNVLSIAYNPITLKEEFTIDVGTFSILPIDSNVYDGLGVIPVPTTSASTYNSPNIPDLSGLTKIYLRSRALSANNSANSDGLSGNIMSVIPNTSALKTPISYLSPTEASDTIVYNGSTDLTTMDFRLTDKDDILLDFNGGDILIVLKIYYLR
jgi:hypothetical protein